jgi:8-oxo-dGTP pyrophosphatase MutT (NUDIX family)
MYKVFFNDRKIFLTDDFIRSFQLRNGLFYKFQETEELKDLLEFYRFLKKIDQLYIFHPDLDELRNAFRSCFKNINAAGGLIRNKTGQYLFIRRRGKWDLPKGKLDKGESFEEAALREVTEECGIRGMIILCRLMSTYHSYLLDNEPVLKKTLWFEMLYSGEKAPVPQKAEDITEIRWVAPSDLSTITNDTYLSVIDVLKYAMLVDM